MNSKPFIGINADFRSAQGDKPAFSYLASGYYDAISEIGGLPLLIPPLEEDDDLNAVLDRLDGVLLVGGAGPITHLTCIKAETGERAWQKTRFGKGNFIAADGKLFITTVKGELVIARATPKAYQEIGRKEVLGFTRQAPALAGGLLYLRDDAEILCLDVRGAR